MKDNRSKNHNETQIWRGVEDDDPTPARIRRLSLEDYHAEIARDEEEKAGGWFTWNKEFFEEKAMRTKQCL